jgi:hypothetical protein
MKHDARLAEVVVSGAAIYCPADGEAIRISHYDDEGFYGQGEESGEEYQVLGHYFRYEEVDFDTDLFYKLVLIEVA